METMDEPPGESGARVSIPDFKGVRQRGWRLAPGAEMARIRPSARICAEIR